MSLPTVLCTGKTRVDITVNGCTECRDLIFECIKVKKVFDEFALRDCVEGIRFDLDKLPAGNTIEPLLILRHCKISNVEIKDISSNCEKRLRISGRCCCDVFGKDTRGNIIKLKVVNVPSGTNISEGSDGELCFNFNVRRTYPNATNEDFERFVHFLEEGRFELQCLSEAVIDDENNTTDSECLVTNLGMFVAIKLDAEVQLCVPTLGYCFVEEDIAEEEDFCERFGFESLPSFNPPQLNMGTVNPYCRD